MTMSGELGVRLGQVRRRATASKCLFGTPDPVETEKMYQEQMQRERERFQRRWNVDLDQLEAEVNQRLKTVTTTAAAVAEDRLPVVESRLEEEESSPAKGQRTCGKPCVKFQKRVRVTGRLKRQTCLTEFWRSRRSLGFVFGKGKMGLGTVELSLQVTEVLEAPARD